MNIETEHNVTQLLATRTINHSREMLNSVEHNLEIANTEELENIIKAIETAYLELSKLT